MVLLLSPLTVVAIDACLFQVYDGLEHLISFISKKLDKHQRSYATVENEAYALKTTVKYFRVYPDTGMPIQIYSDHSPLQYLKKCPIATTNCCAGDCHCRSCRYKLAIHLDEKTWWPMCWVVLSVYLRHCFQKRELPILNTPRLWFSTNGVLAKATEECYGLTNIRTSH